MVNSRMNQPKAGRPKNGANKRGDVHGIIAREANPYDPNKNGTHEIKWHEAETALLDPTDDVVTVQERLARDRIANGGTGGWINEVSVRVEG